MLPEVARTETLLSGVEAAFEQTGNRVAWRVRSSCSGVMDSNCDLFVGFLSEDESIGASNETKGSRLLSERYLDHMEGTKATQQDARIHDLEVAC